MSVFRFLIDIHTTGTRDAEEWIAVVTAADAKSDFKTGFSLPSEFTAGEKDQARQLFHGTADTSQSRARIENSERLGTAEFRAANFLRAKAGGPILRSSNSDSVFLLHRVGAELFAPFTLTRMNRDGKPLWSTATGIGRLQQVLPGADAIALIGERTPAPNKVPEPILVLVSATTGTTSTVSLWR